MGVIQFASSICLYLALGQASGFGFAIEHGCPRIVQYGWVSCTKMDLVVSLGVWDYVLIENSWMFRTVIDPDGFRPNVGIILTNDQGLVFWARRIGQDAWQFPQGGIDENESPREALYRELAEEVGLEPEHVVLIGSTTRWLRYHLPRHLIRRHHRPVCIGQKQLWFMLRLVGSEADVRLDAGDKPEFDHWRWVDYWRPASEVVFFKRQVYRRALRELAPLAFPDGVPEPPSSPGRDRSHARRGPGRS